MADKQPADIHIPSLRGGMVDSESPTNIPDDACTLAVNVEWEGASVAERRNGCEPLDISDSDLVNEDRIVHISQWFPTNDTTTPEIWVIAATPGVSVTMAYRDTSGVWHTVTPGDAIDPDEPDIYNIVSQPLNGKLFWAYPSAVNRMHVWTGTAFRATGLKQPGAIPSVVDEGAGTDYIAPRYFRVRFVVLSGSTVLLRSEPSASFGKIPSGTGAGLTITRPTLINEGETHWEVEASYDNANFYRIARIAVATTTYNDEVTDTVGYADAPGAVLSEELGQYELQQSARFLTVDGDRLILGGHWTNLALGSGVWWTPVLSDPGAGNDERMPIESIANDFLSLDNYAGGSLTGLAPGISGAWYAFKWSRIYKMGRSGDVLHAYTSLTISTSRGAFMGSICPGMDENGSPCIYFADPRVGPSRLGAGGLQAIIGLKDTWRRINLRATLIAARAVYYLQKQQMKWWLAADGENTPNLGITVQVSELRQVNDAGIGRGLSLFTGHITDIYAAAALSERTTTDGMDVLNDRPFVGMAGPDFLQRCDVNTTDAGVAYIATVRSKPFMLAGLLNRWGAMVPALLATANAGTSVIVRFIRDLGIESTQRTVLLDPEGAETEVVKTLDDLAMSESRLIQIELSDI